MFQSKKKNLSVFCTIEIAFLAVKKKKLIVYFRYLYDI